MIGILCEKNKKNIYAKKIYKLLNRNIKYKTKSIIVFSISDLDFSNKTVEGKLITQSKIKSLTMPFPKIIYNFMSPKKRMSRKKIRILAEQTDIILINEVNRFKQHMIMEILSSSAKTKDFVPNYSIYDSKKNMNQVLEKNEALLFPETGNNCEIHYAIQNSISSNIKEKLSSRKKWLVIDNPNIYKENENPIIFTVYAIRDAEDKWNVLHLSTSEGVTDSIPTQILYKSTMKIAECISNFIPLLAFCTVKFVMDENNFPFVVNFSGWDSSLLLKKQKSRVHDLFVGYFFDYSNLLLYSKGGENYVD